MMYLKILLGFSLVLFVKGQIHAQSNPTPQTVSYETEIEINDKGQTVLRVRVERKNIMERIYYCLGTPYLGDNWFEGSFLDAEGNTIKGLLAFDVVSNSLFYTESDKGIAEEIRPVKFTLGTTTLYLLDHLFDGTAGYYYQVVSGGEPLLLKQYFGNFIQDFNHTGQVGYGSNANGDFEGTYEKQEKLYIVIQKQLSRVNNKRGFYKSLGPYSQKAMAFNKTNKLDLKNESDVILLINHLSAH